VVYLKPVVEQLTDGGPPTGAAPGKKGKKHLFS
jgi:hypothetical protein